MTDLSIVIPTYNEAKFIHHTLSRLTAAMNASSLSYEILVVDNASTDATPLIAARFKETKVLRLNQRETIALARNIGASEAKGTLLAFIDADVLVTTSWSDRMQQKFKEIVTVNNVITGAQYRISEEPGWIERYWFRSMEERLPRYINAGNLVVSREVFGNVKGFDAKLVTGEDVEFCLRARKMGFYIRPDPGFVVHHEGYPKKLFAFFKRELWLGRGDYSSLSAFLHSKTAVTAVVVAILLALTIVSILLGHWYWAISLALSVMAISMVSVKYKYGISSLSRFSMNSAIMVVYLVARALAFINFEKKP